MYQPQQQQCYYQQNDYPVLATDMIDNHMSAWSFDDNKCTGQLIQENSEVQYPLLLATSFLPTANEEMNYYSKNMDKYHYYTTNALTTAAVAEGVSTANSSNCTSPSSFFTSPSVGGTEEPASYAFDDFSYDKIDALLLQAITPIAPAPLELVDNVPVMCDKISTEKEQQQQLPATYCSNTNKSEAALSSSTPTQNQQKGRNKVFPCTSCSRSFARKHDLQRHARVHSGEKPYTCPSCNKSFARTDALKRHLRVEEKCRTSPVIQALKQAGNRRYRNL